MGMHVTERCKLQDFTSHFLASELFEGNYNEPSNVLVIMIFLTGNEYTFVTILYFSAFLIPFKTLCNFPLMHRFVFLDNFSPTQGNRLNNHCCVK